ncbi:hypothetical protein B0H14DRAFT_1417263 [Mycena olivaceomarginata]|nr:hypothetical protein B0H14DRAFT_1417263 [Mycena olivaceomarginata]
MMFGLLQHHLIHSPTIICLIIIDPLYQIVHVCPVPTRHGLSSILMLWILSATSVIMAVKCVSDCPIPHASASVSDCGVEPI